jgi:hypothetical protein
MEHMKLGLTAKQIAQRRRSIGGSDAGAIVAGGEEWLKLWRIKTGRAEPEDLSNVLAVQMGSFTEPLNAYWYTRQTGREVTERNRRFVHPDYPFIVANLDGITTTSGGQPAYIDFKHLGQSGDAVTLRYTAQCTHCAAILGLDWWVLSCFIGNRKWELVEAEVDPFFAHDYLAKAAAFWAFVETDREPPMSPPLPVPPPPKLRTIRLEEGMETEYNWGPECVRLIRVFAETDSAAKLNALTRENIKKLVPEDVGTLTRGRFKLARDKAGAVRMSLKAMPADE